MPWPQAARTARWTPERRRKHSEQMKAAWRNPEKRQRWLTAVVAAWGKLAEAELRQADDESGG